MTTPDLEALAREHDQTAAEYDANARYWRTAGDDKMAAKEEAQALTHRQAAALIRGDHIPDVGKMVPRAPGREEIARELEARRDLQADAQWLRDRLALIRRICERNGPSHLKVAEIRNLLKDPS